ncbi:translocation protein SEC63 homolog [Magallana gigas]|uniref:translocation protein SEC63 homolog n=1 Tax=Magallana gigas TaxID=29159 RepID=UPI003342CE05
MNLIVDHLHPGEEYKLKRYPCQIKALVLLLAHFLRLRLPPNTLAIDQAYIVKKSPYLINEMINVIAQLVTEAQGNVEQNMPRLETIENCMKVSQMLIQAIYVRTSPLLQLPHITQDMLKHFITTDIQIRKVLDLITMKEKDRRSLLNFLTQDEYNDIINVCASLPYITMEVFSSGNVDTDIKAGSWLELRVNLKRQMMEVLFDKKDMSHLFEDQDSKGNTSKQYKIRMIGYFRGQPSRSLMGTDIGVLINGID